MDLFLRVEKELIQQGYLVEDFDTDDVVFLQDIIRIVEGLVKGDNKQSKSSSDFVILYHNGEYEKAEGSLEDVIGYLKDNDNYKDYGRNGATVFQGKEVYSVSDKMVETIHE